MFFKKGQKSLLYKIIIIKKLFMQTIVSTYTLSSSVQNK